MLESIREGSQLLKTFLKPRMLELIRGESTYKCVLEAADVGIDKGGGESTYKRVLEATDVGIYKGGESTYKHVLEAADVGIDKGGVNL